MEHQNFRDRYCSSNNLPVEQFAKNLILEASYPQARLFYKLLLSMGETKVESESNLLYDLGQAQDIKKIDAMINGALFASYLRKIGGIRKKLKLRVSGASLVKIARGYFD